MHAIALFLQNPNFNPEMARHFFLAMMALIPVFIVIGIAIVMVPFWFILKKAGFSPWLSLVCLIPSLGVLVLLYLLAFAAWRVVPAPQQAYWPPPQPPQPPQPPYTS